MSEIQGFHPQLILKQQQNPYQKTRRFCARDTFARSANLLPALDDPWRSPPINPPISALFPSVISEHLLKKGGAFALNGPAVVKQNASGSLR
jgi:hypothetical protein